jgi:hypothetical protein
MRRTRVWLLILASVLGVVAVALLVVYVGLPGLVKWVIIRQGRSQLGRDVSIERVRLDAWNGWYRVEGLRIAGRPGEPPLLEVKEIDLRVVYGQLFQGRIRARQLVITSPLVRLARLESGELSISDITRRFVDDEKEPASEKEPIEIFADLILVSNGLVLFEDRAVTPARTFEMKDLTVNLRDITTKLHAKEGTGTIAFVLNGSPVAAVARHVRVRPAHLTAQLNVVDFDVDEVWAYVPLAGAPVHPTGGRFSTSIDLVYDAVTGIKVTLDTILAGLTLLREGQVEPLVSLPQVTLGVRNLTARDGAVSLERLEIDTDTSIVDGSLSPPRRYAIDDLHLVVDNVAYPSGTPANVQLSMKLPEGATLDVRGTAAPKPLAINLTLTLANADLALVNAYIPPVSPITVQKGRVGATLEVEASEGPALRVNGEIIAGYSLLLRGQTPPLVEHPRNVLKITDFTWRPGAAAMRRLTAEGPATIVDASVTPPQRAHFTTLTLQADDITFPVERPVRVKSTAIMGTSGSSTLEGTFNPATLAADIRARFTDVDVTRVGPYIPPTAPVAITGGRLAATVAVKHDQRAGLTVNADGAVAGLAVAHRGARTLAITDRRLAFAVDHVHMLGNALTIRRATLKGAPGFVDESVTPAQTLKFRALSASVRDLTWPARRPVPVELTADLPEAGTLAVTGTAKLDPPAIDLTVDLKDAALGPYQVFLPFDAPIAGEASAALTVAARMASGLTAKGSGQAELRQFRLGPPDRPPIAVESVAATGIDLTWPGNLRVDLVQITRPTGLLERDRDGTFPLREMLAPRAQAEVPTQTPSAPPASTPAPGGGAASSPALTVAIREVAIEEGNIRFVDQSTVPTYSEEMSRVALKVGNVSTAPGERATIELTSVVGATGALDLKGEIAPTADPFYLDVQGELREMPLPRSNPYFRQVFDWFLKRGTVTNKIHYRVVGDQLTAENDVRVQRLSVEKDTAPVASDKKIGVPLGLIVAMITDRRGDIEFSLPVSGNLKEPGFSLGSAIWAALKNVLTNVATAPFQAIGKLFGKGDEVEELKVDPLTFPAGSAAVNAEGHQHLQRVADFLRASPNIHLELRPVVSADDLAILKTAEVAAQIQRVQRESKLDGFDAAAAQLFAKTFPGQPVPDSAEAIVERLREQAPVADGATVDLATKRLESTRQALVQTGVEADRLSAGGPVAGGEGKGRVEFELSPGG